MTDLKLLEAKRKRSELRAAMNATIRGAYRSFINRAEEQVLRYRVDLDKAFMAGMQAVAHAIDEKQPAGSGHVTILIQDVIDKLEHVGNGYLVAGADIGFERALVDLQHRGWIVDYQRPVHAPSSVFERALKQNTQYLRDSLYPELKKQIEGGRNVADVAQVLRARVAMYSHYVWVASEQAYKTCMQQFFAKARPKLKESLREGGPGSGDYGHSGRPGEVGGAGASEKPLRWKHTNTDAWANDTCATCGKAPATLYSYGERPARVGEPLFCNSKCAAQAKLREGGPGSGDHGHAGRKGQVGGSMASGQRVLDEGNETFKYAGGEEYQFVGFPTDAKVKRTALNEINKVAELVGMDKPNTVVFAENYMARMDAESEWKASGTTWVGATMITPATSGATVMAFNPPNLFLRAFGKSNAVSDRNIGLSGSDYKYIAAVADHEMGHYYYNHVMSGEYRRAWREMYDANFDNMPSAYAKESSGEGFAESFSSYLNGWQLHSSLREFMHARLGDKSLRSSK